MPHEYMLEKLASEHIRERRLANCRRTLSAIARCCRPSTWRLAARRLRRNRSE
jgi:hypothetical protein